MDAPDPLETPDVAKPQLDERYAFQVGYRVFAYFGLMSLIATLLWGFRFNGEASWLNYPVNILLYTAFLAPHLLLTRPEVKDSVWGNLAGTVRERQYYITITIVTWLLVFWLHRPVPGGHLDVPAAVRFVALIGFLWSMLLFFQGMTREAIDGLLGVPGTDVCYAHDEEVPLHTTGQYAEVRHPMYRAVVLMGVAGLIYHPNAGQLLWTAMLGITFIGFIPVEESLLRESHGDAYRDYCKQTPYRLFRGVW